MKILKDKQITPNWLLQISYYNKALKINCVPNLAADKLLKYNGIAAHSLKAPILFYFLEIIFSNWKPSVLSREKNSTFT